MSLPREGRHQVPQLVRVSNDIDRRDLAVANVERGGLQDAAIDADIAGQAVDFGGAQQLRRGRVLAAQPGEQTESAIEAADDVAEGQHLAAAVRMDFTVLRNPRCKRCGLAIARRSEERREGKEGVSKRKTGWSP